MTVSKVSPGVTLTLKDGKERTITFDFWAFYLLEEKTGRNALNGEMFSAPSARDLVTLVWAGLQGSEKLSLEEVGHLMTFDVLPAVTKAIQDAFKLSQGDSAKNESAGEAVVPVTTPPAPANQ